MTSPSPGQLKDRGWVTVVGLVIALAGVVVPGIFAYANLSNRIANSTPTATTVPIASDHAGHSFVIVSGTLYTAGGTPSSASGPVVGPSADTGLGVAPNSSWNLALIAGIGCVLTIGGLILAFGPRTDEGKRRQSNI